ncbi:MAG: glycosyltransferase family 2 protein [Crocinitomicaceae bacterium]|nr:glycosyltransferase family 2 protein [Crocinitomicaceae bacterium]
MKDVAVVILNWNGKDLLEKFLPTILEHSGDAQIVVADNASEDDSIKYIEEHFPSVRVIKNQINEGFARGYNQALKHVESEYYVLLNSDVEVTPNWLEPLYEAMQNKSVAGCQPKILAHGNKDIFEHAGASGGFIDKNYYPFCRGRLFSKVEIDVGQYDSVTEIFWASGACLMIRAELFHTVGGFDEDFFAHMEEIDLCWRLKKMNFSFLAIPASTVYHVGGGTLPYESSNKVFLNFRNSLIMIAKNHEGNTFGILLYRKILDGVAGAMFLFKGQFSNLWAVLRAHYSFGLQRIKIKDKRYKIQRQSTTFNDAGFYSGSILWAFYFKKIKRFSALNQRFFK